MTRTLAVLLLSVSLSAFRNTASKKTAKQAKTMPTFFFSQAVLFLAAAALSAVCNSGAFAALSAAVVGYGILYGILLVLSQWMLTFSLRSGSTSVCSVIYSLGFVLPAVSGALFWHEPFTRMNALGLVLALTVILLTVKKNGSEPGGKSYLPYLLIAMSASGGLGILQKAGKTSGMAGKESAFLLCAFLFAFFCSFAAFLLCRGTAADMCAQKLSAPVLSGLAFGGANLCNTLLAGSMKSAVFFPVQNIGTVLLSTLLGMALFREKPTARTAAVLFLGSLTLLAFSL